MGRFDSIDCDKDVVIEKHPSDLTIEKVLTFMIESGFKKLEILEYSKQTSANLPPKVVYKTTKFEKQTEQ
jgi:hypothetical protein